MNNNEFRISMSSIDMAKAVRKYLAENTPYKEENFGAVICKAEGDEIQSFDIEVEVK